ncbi:MAG TPA: 6-phosphogluconate dehydrogenase [Casimicrobiaceae bacterium]|nr:6-phosphogluconate dehydrogenase [Casimicrobiaceae bacterium]
MKKALALVALVAVLLAGAVGWFVVAADYSEGFRVGKVIKLSHKGYVFKTWEGTLDFGYLQNDPDAGVATRIWDFSVAPGDDEVRRQIDTAIAGDYKVKLHYREKYVKLPWRGDTKHFVTKVERAS